MFLSIQEKTIEFTNDQDQIDVIISVINEYLQQNDLKLAHLLIDGVLVCDNVSEYLVKNFSDIDKIEVVIFNPKEIVSDTLVMTYEYLTSAIPLIRGLAEEFYQHPEEKTWISLNDLFEGLQWIIESLSKIDNCGDLETAISNYEIWNEYVKSVSILHELVPQLEVVILNKDYISIADLLLYEVVPVFESMLEKLIFILPKQEEASVS